MRASNRWAAHGAGLVEDGKVVQIGWQGRGCMWGTAQRLALTARRILVRGVVQGVGFRPFVFRLARANAIRGWVLNEETWRGNPRRGPGRKT